jgi:hypothetical protein
MVVRIRENIVPIVIDKCLASQKATTKLKALECLLLFIEKDTAEPIIQDLVQGCSKKQPKVVAACFNALSKSLEAFGNGLINPKPILKILPMAFQHSDKLVRDEVGTLLFYLFPIVL